MLERLKNWLIGEAPEEEPAFITMEAHQDALGNVINANNKLLEQAESRVAEVERYNEHLKQHVETLEAALRSRS